MSAKMFENKSEITPESMNLLLKGLLDWQLKDVKNEDKAFNCFYDKNEYLLRMLWQGRLSKMNDTDKELNVWISENYVPKEYGFDKTKIRDLQLDGLNFSHEELAQTVLKEVWKDYLSSDLHNFPKPPKEKVGFFKKIFK